MRVSLKLAFTFACLAPFASAATFIVPPDRELIRRSDVIVTGTAITSFAQKTPEGGIETVTPFAVGEVIKGTSLPHIIDVVEPGGALGEVASMVSGSPRFEAGQHLLLLLKQTGDDRWSVVELVLGKFRFVDDVSGTELLVRDEEQIEGWDPDLRPHRERRRSAAAFLDYVRRGGTAGTYFVESEPVVVRPVAPNAAFSATSYTMTIGSSGQGSRWNVFPNGVTFYAGSSGEPGAPGNGTTAVQAALATWTNDPGSNVNYVYGGLDSTHTQGLHAADGANTVLFERDLSAWGVSPFTCSGNSYSGTLGLGGVTSAGGSNSVNGETFLTTQEGDVEMNRGLANCTLLFSNGDFNTAVAHEVGHTLGFRHSDQNRQSSGPCSGDPTLECSTSAVMKSFVPGGINAALQPWDIDAVRSVYPGTTPNVSPGPGTVGTRGDFNADRKADILLRSSAGGVGMWLMNGTGIIGGGSVGSASGYTIAGIGDFNGDGKADILLLDSRGGVGMWLMNGSTIAGGGSVGSASGYTIAGVGDFNGDGTDDILLRDGSGNLGVWFMNGPSIIGGGSIGSAAGYTVAGVGDFNGDGKADILLRSSTGSLGMWFINGTSIIGGGSVGSAAGYTIAGVADFNGDGKADILLQSSTGAIGMWVMSGTSIVGGGSVGAAVGLTVVATKDYNGDGKADVLLRDVNGSLGMWLLSGPLIVGGGSPGNPGSGYTEY